MTQSRYWSRLSPSSSSVEPRHHEARLHHHLLRRFRKMSAQLKNSISDVSWLLCVSAPVGDHGDAGYLGLPPIAANEPIICLIWEHIALLHTGPLEDRSNAATSLRNDGCVELEAHRSFSSLIHSNRQLRGFLSSRRLGVRCSVSLDRDTPITDSFSSHPNFFTRAKQVKGIEISDQHSLAIWSLMHHSGCKFLSPTGRPMRSKSQRRGIKQGLRLKRFVG
ncbi:hypothetical protein HID58_032091 [Brassica napus]|uniref:Uncharacterized protein n=1 Tax=Brassica napus TaxID=3708 RepID=A0ABQ8BWY5_BRANA|nr:hypothetical protein HID58_032091 [Brassica napus]